MSTTSLSLPPGSTQRDPAFVSRLIYGLLTLAVIAPLFPLTEFNPMRLLTPESLKAMGKFIAEFFPPALNGEFLLMVARETWRTVAIATAGLTLALFGAIPMALLATRPLSLSALNNAGRMAWIPATVRQGIRALMVVLRTIPELVWALAFVRVVGLGPTAGVLAIALTYAGMLGKVYAEILESSDRHASDTLMRNGASRLQAFFYGLLPQNASELTSYTVYRWECAIRSSVVMGFVGAGGLGQELDNSMRLFNGSEVATMLLVFILLVAVADRFSRLLRRLLG
jgi:phosphonate transport system permease protein